ncbi:hypothetical protein HMPREF9628_01304 [Peptoanaerobacter stomatis]|uniref:Uncharacterized protein n=1 Tax=Peptoanaerobacter stomatis TaxID=796937 RepID=G9XBD7_9FIRM|nr:hypothetical protein [Peptoanaerobacter stomatis]EHL19788.1 hypothetical protein HMPREF9628_01304 [Peptoanaerobacter stomatis]
MYKLQYMNVVREVATEVEKNQLILEGYELMEDIKDDEETYENTENEISQDTDISKEQAEDIKSDEKNQDEEKTDNKKSGKKK